MRVKKQSFKQVDRLFLGLSILYVSLICALGVWWLYLIVQFGEKIKGLGGGNTNRLISMVKWEGFSFFFLLVLLTISLLFLYLKDIRKTKAMQAFFASMTHELKTPLASVKLQGEVIHDAIERLSLEKLSQKEYVQEQKIKIDRLSHRLMEDGYKLELTMDKILQLSRLEGGGQLHLGPFNPKELFAEVIRKYNEGLTIKSQWNHHSEVIGDEFALSLIFKNLLENTRIHSTSTQVEIASKENRDHIVITYRDHGEFKGDPKKLGSLFYKFKSKKGSGIGIYLIINLMEKMNGTCSLEVSPSLNFTLTLKKAGRNAQA